jgi:hypothetical protein
MLEVAPYKTIMIGFGDCHRWYIDRSCKIDARGMLFIVRASLTPHLTFGRTNWALLWGRWLAIQVKQALATFPE